MADFERSLIGQALELTGGNKKRAAEILGISRETLYQKIKLYESRDNLVEYRGPR